MDPQTQSVLWCSKMSKSQRSASFMPVSSAISGHRRHISQVSTRVKGGNLRIFDSHVGFPSNPLGSIALEGQLPDVLNFLTNANARSRHRVWTWFSRISNLWYEVLYFSSYLNQSSETMRIMFISRSKEFKNNIGASRRWCASSCRKSGVAFWRNFEFAVTSEESVLLLVSS